MTFLLFITLSTSNLLRPEVQAFIHAHEQDDVVQLVLQGHQYPDIPIKAVAAQIQARQKAKHKFPDWYQQAGVIFPPTLSVEQASSEITARYKASLMRGKHLVDLSGGMGIDTYYLSQSFQYTDYVEQQEALVALAAHNFQTLGQSQIKTHHSTAEEFLEKLSSKAECLYLDPARRDEQKRKVFRLEDCTPNVVALRDVLLDKGKKVLIKTAPLLDIHAALEELSHVEKVVVIAVNQDCKEVLYLLDREMEGETQMETIHFLHDSVQNFVFSRSQEERAEVTYAEPLSYLYEPNATILKAGAFKAIAEAFQMHKLHPNSHLYTSNELQSHFPGRIFRIKEVSKYHKKSLKALIPSGKANITTRNFPDSVQQIRKKTGIKEGGDTYIFATTAQDNKNILLITEKI
ncbi:THUMP-like domain-containing protein [Catalinimonas niigatensis]|uniref:THUMP-like domain-containing protein n=1 Tax=Catalinimonas niigatensis TaxID=1397264 RepID=UPI0026662740|nr:hypothetical protein [Catalinimonas niigatensis]WPP52300.1 hypothetical protein PZB72_07895 [Catalinimonas niigatensis]